MAKGNERQNPEFDPTRIVRPTAAPVDLYFRPMLRGPEPSQLMQVAEALGGISPTLNRLASDAAAAGIAAEKNAGTWQAETEKNPEVLRRKATEAIEKAGGLAPWRFQSYLEAYGQREVRDKYRKALYENIDDLSNPYNADGTLRSVDYISQKMQEMYEKVGLPTDSYYIQKGAAAARAEADNSFYDRLMNARRQKVIQSNSETLADGLAFTLETKPDLAAEFADGGLVKMQLDLYYQQGGQDGNEILAKTVISTANGLASQGNYDRAKKLLDLVLDPPKGGAAIGRRFRASVQESLDVIERKERDEEFQDAQRRESRKDIARTSARESLLNTLVDRQTKAPNNYISMTAAERTELVKQVLSGVEAPEDIKTAISGDLTDWVRVQTDAMNRPPAADERAQNMVLETIYQDSISLSPKELDDRVTGLMEKGLITFPQAMAMRERNKQYHSLSPFDREASSLRLAPLRNWTGLLPEQIASDGRVEIAGIAARAEVEVMDAFLSHVNSPEFKAKNPNEATAASARNEVLDRLVSERVSKLRTEHAGKLEQYNLTKSFDATVGQQYSAEADAFIPVALSSLGMQPDGGVEYTSLASRASQILLDRIRSEWGSIAAESGAAPMTLEQRRRELYRRIPDIKDRFYLELRNNPDSLGIPSQLSNIIKANTRPPAAGTTVGGVEGKAGALQPVSQGVGEFKSEGILARGAEYNAIFPSENDLVSTASETSRLANEARAVPEMRAKHDESKARLGQLAEKIIQEMRTTSVRDINFGNVPKTLQRAPGALPDLPLYEIRPDGVYVLSGLDGSRSPSPLMTRRYWAAKALTGYTQDEILGATTTEGVKIPKQNLDATEYLYFKSAQEFADAVDAFTKSAGKSGIIADRYLPLTGMTFEEFRSAQFNLIGTRKPLTAAAPTTIQE